MRDLDSAVGRLDNILMTVYLFIVVLLLAVAFVRTSPSRAGVRARPLTRCRAGSATAHPGDDHGHVHPQYVASPGLR